MIISFFEACLWTVFCQHYRIWRTTDRMLLEGIIRFGPLALLISFALQRREYCLQIEYICLFSLCLTYIHILRYLYLPTLLYLFFCFSSSLCVCWPALGSCDLFITLSSSWACGAPIYSEFYLLLVHVYWPTDLSSIFVKCLVALFRYFSHFPLYIISNIFDTSSWLIYI